MNVRHDGNVFMDKRHIGDVSQLLDRHILHLDTLGPRLDRESAAGVYTVIAHHPSSMCGWFTAAGSGPRVNRRVTGMDDTGRNYREYSYCRLPKKRRNRTIEGKRR